MIQFQLQWPYLVKLDTEERVLQERDKGSQDKGLEDRDTLDKDLVDRALSGKGKDLVDKSVPDTVVDLALARVVQDSSATKAADLGAEASQELDMEEEDEQRKQEELKAEFEPVTKLMKEVLGDRAFDVLCGIIPVSLLLVIAWLALHCVFCPVLVGSACLVPSVLLPLI